MTPSKRARLSKAPKTIAALGDSLKLQLLDDIKSGVYFLCRGSSVVYVGQSFFVFGRLHDHARDLRAGRSGARKFDRAFYISVPVVDLDSVEQAFISHLRPVGNKASLRKLRADDAKLLSKLGINGAFDEGKMGEWYGI